MPEEWTADNVRKILLNPLYCLSEPPIVSEGQWIEANAKLIRKLGPEMYLRQLLDAIKDPDQ